MPGPISIPTVTELLAYLAEMGVQLASKTFPEAMEFLGLSGTTGALVVGGGSNALVTTTGAAEAFTTYSATGALSANGAATASNAIAPNVALSYGGAASTGIMGVLNIGADVALASAIALKGWQIGNAFWNGVEGQYLSARARQILEPFYEEGTKVIHAYVDENGKVRIDGQIVEALDRLLKEEYTTPFGKATCEYSQLDQYLYYPSAYNFPTEPGKEPSVFFCKTQGEVGLYNNLTGVLHQGWSVKFESDDVIAVRMVESDLFASSQKLMFFNRTRTEGLRWLTHLPNQKLSWNISTVGYTRKLGQQFFYTTAEVDVNQGDAGYNWYDPSQVFTTYNVTGSIDFAKIASDIATILYDLDGGNIKKPPVGLAPFDGTVPVDYTADSAQIGEGDDAIEVVPIQINPEVPYVTTTSTDPQAVTAPETIEKFIPNEIPADTYAPGNVETPTNRTSVIPNPAQPPQPQTSPELDPVDIPPSVGTLQLPEPSTPPGSTGYSPLPFVPLLSGFPTIVPSSGPGLIHVYNPTPAEFVAFGQWLWVTYADASIDKIWNNPFDGVIGAHELYATPAVDGRDNIYSGFLTCPTQANLVRQRYTKLDCGSIVIPEYYGNYLDYSPYTKVHIYLPFIGIVELNSDDIIGHAVNTTYYIDAYNGSCIAQITVARSGYENTVYQYSGNCAVEVPLAGGSQAAIRAGMISAAATGISSVIGGVASMLGGRIGAGVGTIAYGLGSAVSQAVSNKSSVQHSGTFGASYGAMGIKKPYIIVHRPIEKEVYVYNRDYGYPAHKRVIIGQCTGYLRVREVDVVSATATDEEKKKIEELLKGGVFV